MKVTMMESIVNDVFRQNNINTKWKIRSICFSLRRFYNFQAVLYDFQSIKPILLGSNATNSKIEMKIVFYAKPKMTSKKPSLPEW